MNPNPISVLASHAIESLPDSLAKRKAVLRALEDVLPEKHPALPVIRSHLATLKAVEKLEAELPLKFSL